MYADWLEEQRCPRRAARAELIRAQVAGDVPPARFRFARTHDGLFYPECSPAEGFDWPGAYWAEVMRRALVGTVDPVAELPARLRPVEWLEFRRGFVGHVTLPLAAWLGWPCRACGGRGHDHPNPGATVAGLRAYDMEHLICSACGGAGRAAGDGPDLVKAHPLEGVRLDGRVPHWFGTGADTGYGWLIAANDARRDTIPIQLYCRLPGGATAGRRVGGRTQHLPARLRPTAEGAIADLSGAAIAWARAPRPAGATS